MRQGRIKYRPANIQRPSREAASVEEFAIWWRKRQTAREAKRTQQRKRSDEWLGPPEPMGWLSIAETAAVLGLSAKHVPWLINHGQLEGTTVGQRRWVTQASAQQLAAVRRADGSEWISHAEAAQIVGCSTNTILRMVNAGKIEKREAPRAVPSLRRSSVEAFARIWRARRSP